MMTKYGPWTALRSIPSSEPRRSIRTEAMRLPSQIYRWCLREAKIRQAIRELEQLDDHALKDIGLQRGAIESLIRAGRTKQR